MTDTTPLRERVEKALWETKSLSAFVDAAIALIESETLERAAQRVRDELFNRSCCCSFVAEAAIRAMKEKP